MVELDTEHPEEKGEDDEVVADGEAPDDDTTLEDPSNDDVGE